MVIVIAPWIFARNLNIIVKQYIEELLPVCFFHWETVMLLLKSEKIETILLLMVPPVAAVARATWEPLFISNGQILTGSNFVISAVLVTETPEHQQPWLATPAVIIVRGWCHFPAFSLVSVDLLLPPPRVTFTSHFVPPPQDSKNFFIYDKYTLPFLHSSPRFVGAPISK